MINTSKLKGRITERRTTIQKLAKIVKLTPYTLGRQISNKSKMSIDTAARLGIELLIPESEMTEYFFVEKVAKCNEFNGQAND